MKVLPVPTSEVVATALIEGRVRRFHLPVGEEERFAPGDLFVLRERSEITDYTGRWVTCTVVKHDGPKVLLEVLRHGP